MNKSLIYYVCYGTKQLPLLSASIESVRVLGKYTGEIIVFSDQKVSIPGCDYLEVIETKNNLNEQFESRVNCGLTISGDYSSVAYLDNDILAIRNIKPFFEETEYFKAMGFNTVLNRPKVFNWPLSNDEIEIAKNMELICSGAIISSYSLFIQTLKLWKEVIINAPSNIVFLEQSALNILIIKKLIKFKQFDNKIISPFENGDNCLVHYLGKFRKNEMLRRWEEIKLLNKYII